METITLATSSTAVKTGSILEKLGASLHKFFVPERLHPQMQDVPKLNAERILNVEASTVFDGTATEHALSVIGINILEEAIDLVTAGDDAPPTALTRLREDLVNDGDIFDRDKTDITDQLNACYKSTSSGSQLTTPVLSKEHKTLLRDFINNSATGSFAGTNAMLERRTAEIDILEKALQMVIDGATTNFATQVHYLQAFRLHHGNAEGLIW